MMTTNKEVLGLAKLHKLEILPDVIGIVDRKQYSEELRQQLGINLHALMDSDVLIETGEDLKSITPEATPNL